MLIAESPLAKHPVGKSDDSIAQFATQIFIVVFGGDVPFDTATPVRVNSGQRGFFRHRHTLTEHLQENKTFKRAVIHL